MPQGWAQKRACSFYYSLTLVKAWPRTQVVWAAPRPTGVTTQTDQTHPVMSQLCFWKAVFIIRETCYKGHTTSQGD